MGRARHSTAQFARCSNEWAGVHAAYYCIPCRKAKAVSKKTSGCQILHEVHECGGAGSAAQMSDAIALPKT